MKITIEISSLDEIEKLMRFLESINNNSQEQYLETPIQETDLIQRTKNGLINDNILTVRQLLELSETDLLKKSNIGKKALTQIKDFLESKNLKLKTHY